jgi:hypothetical protein
MKLGSVRQSLQRALPGLSDAVSLRVVRGSLVVSALLGAALCSVPLLGLPGLESALVLGVVLPSLCAAIGARLSFRTRERAASSEALLAQSLGCALCVIGLPVLLLALNGLRVRNCEPLLGLSFVALGPLFGCALAAIWGALCGALPLGRRACVLLALLGPLGEIAHALYALYATPAVFSYGHFFGYFPGSLYDELITLPPQLVLLRCSSALAIGALCFVLLAHRDAALGTLRLRPRPSAFALSASAVVFLGCVLAVQLQREELGLATSREHIAKTLGGRHTSARCELYVPAEMRGEDRKRLAEDCDFRVREMERFFGVAQRERITVLAFRSAAEKKYLMGAASTNIAKPWRGEIYIEAWEWPHSILAHELAHIVAGNVGIGPMRVTGMLGGLLPDLALVEGVAVAAAWTSSAPAGLSPHQWTAAMLDAGLAPRLADVLGTGFLGQQKRLAYTYVGSLVRFISDSYGDKAVRALYMTGDVAGAVGASTDELERRWHAYVQAVPFPPAARALAALRFSGGSVLSSVCPHTRASLKQTLSGALAAGDDEGALRACQQVLEIDPTDVGVRAQRVGVLSRAQGEPAALRELQALEQSAGSNPAVLAAAKHMLADEAARRGAWDAALASYRGLLSAPLDRDAQRLLQVKAFASTGSSRERALLFDLLVGAPGRASDGASAVYLARELRSERKDGLPHYLEARQLFFQKRYRETAALLAEARALGLPSPELSAEALRVQAVASYGDGALGEARALFTLLSHLPAELGFTLEAGDWLSRIAFRARTAQTERAVTSRQR